MGRAEFDHALQALHLDKHLSALGGDHGGLVAGMETLFVELSMADEVFGRTISEERFVHLFERLDDDLRMLGGGAPARRRSAVEETKGMLGHLLDQGASTEPVHVEPVHVRADASWISEREEDAVDGTRAAAPATHD